ncbi:hypothetical protein QTP88_027151 [Uroleucon formosanum]
MPIMTYNWWHSFPKLGELENVPSNKKVEPVLIICFLIPGKMKSKLVPSSKVAPTMSEYIVTILFIYFIVDETKRNLIILCSLVTNIN